MSKVLLSLLAITAIVGAGYYFMQHPKMTATQQDIPTPVFDLWQHWKQENQKTYGGEVETKYRLTVFNQNYNKIREHQQKQDRTYEMNFNKFMDLTASEFSAMFKGFQPKAQNPANVAKLNTIGLPDSVDWRQQGAVNAVKDQGQCGSCWAFSTVGALEGASALFGAKQLQSFSESQLVDCSSSYGNYGCNGGWMDNGFQYVIDNGIATEAEYSYEPVTRSCAKNGGAFKISSYTDVAAGDVDQLAAAAAQQPVAIALDANNFQFYESGVFDDCATQLDHGVTLVGYTSEYWIVRNSWGSSWGEQGYIRLARGNTCGLANVASYPNL